MPGKRNRVISVIIFAFIFIAGVPAKVLACCDDPGSCVLAFATGGLSCVIEEAKKQADHLRQLAQQAHDQVQQQYQQASNDASNKANQAKTDAQNNQNAALSGLDKALDRVKAAELPKRFDIKANIPHAAGLPPAAGQAPAPTLARTGGPEDLKKTASSMRISLPADPQAVKDALARAERQVSSLKDSARTAHVPTIASELGKMDKFLHDSLGQLDNVVHQLVFGPLESVLNTLSNVDPTGLTSLLAALTTSVDTATNAIDHQVFDAVQQLDQSVNTAIGGVENAVNDLTGISAAADQLAKLAEKLANDPTSGNLDALNNALPRDPSRFNHRLLANNSTGMIKFARLKTKGDFGGKFKSAIKPLSTSLAQLKAAPPRVDLSVHKTRLDSFLDAEFRNLTPQQREQRRKALIDEIRRKLAINPKFASDPKASNEIERIVNAAVARIPGSLPPGAAVGLNPQPLPPGAAVGLNPQPLPPRTKGALPRSCGDDHSCGPGPQSVPQNNLIQRQ